MSESFGTEPYYIYPTGGTKGWWKAESDDEEPMTEVPAPGANPEENPERDGLEEDSSEDEDLPLEEDDEEPEAYIPEVVNSYPRREIPMSPELPPRSPPRWALQLESWSKEQGQRPPYGRSRDYFDLSEGTSADRALPVMMSRVTRMVVQQRATAAQMIDVGTEARVNAVRIRKIDEAQDRDETALCQLQVEMIAIRQELRAARDQVAVSEQRARAAELKADAAVKEVKELMGRVTRFYGI